jgi:oxygen-independent coproporphyrinogen-3 oxidase
MKVTKYLAELSEEKRIMLLGNTTQDPLHSAFGSKRVVHAGLMGKPIAGSQYQKKYYESIQKKTDVDGKHAIYIHIPFCQTKCLYCGFYQNASRQEVEDRYLENLLTEIKAEANSPQLKGMPIDCVFIGGGTPTSLSVDNAARLLQTIQQSFCLTADCEVTLEGRIHDLLPEKIETWLNLTRQKIPSS